MMEPPICFDAHWPKLAMFDLDGTLIDSVPGLAAAVDRMLIQLHRSPVGVENVRQWVGNGALMLVRRALAGRIDPSDDGEQDLDRALTMFMEAYADGHSQAAVYPGVRECLAWLHEHDVALALITNKPEQFITPILQLAGLDGYFRCIVGGDTLARQKPDPAGLHHVMAKMGVGANQSCFIGDSRNDVLAAKAAGVCCIGVTYGYNHGRSIREEGADAVVGDLRQLIPCAC